MKAIIFSSYIPTKESLTVWIEFLEMFEKCFKDYDIYIWINYWSVDEWIRILDQYWKKIKIYYWKVEKELSIDSDVSWFQKALELLKKSWKVYDIIWFWHTKWVTTNRDSIRKDIFENFFYKNREIEEKFWNNNLWIFWRYITTTTDLSYTDNNLDKLKKLKYKSANIFYLYIFYVIKWSLIHDFLNNCDSNFFAKNLVNYYWFDRYFFERDFPNIPTRYWYVFDYDIIIHHPVWNINYKWKIALFWKRRFLNDNVIKLKTSLCIVQNKVLYFFFRIIEIILPIKTLNKIKNNLVKIFYKI